MFQLLVGAKGINGPKRGVFCPSLDRKIRVRYCNQVNAVKLFRWGALVVLGLGSACVSIQADRSKAVRNPVQPNVYFACQSHCTRSSTVSGACVEFDREAAPACKLFHERVVSRRRTKHENYVLDQYYGCMQLCEQTTADGLFCRSFGRNQNDLCEGVYKVASGAAGPS